MCHELTISVLCRQTGPAAGALLARAFAAARLIVGEVALAECSVALAKQLAGLRPKGFGMARVERVERTPPPNGLTSKSSGISRSWHLAQR